MHLTPELAEQYLQKQTNTLKNFNINRHLKKCPACSELITKIKDDMLLLDEINNALDEQEEQPSELEQKTLLNLKQKLDSSVR